MRHRTRLGHVLLGVPAAALIAVALAPPGHAQTPAVRPTPYVVAIDAGHGGTPDNNDPAVPFDPGVIGPTGLLEKDVTLAVAQRVQTLLVAQGVRVAMTRTDDRYVSITARMQTALDNHANLFVSIHMNGFPDPTVGGTTVLYPSARSIPFAQVMSDTLGKQLAPLGLADDGIQLKDDLWVHATMPAITVEGAFLSNPREEALMRQTSARDTMAAGIVAGIDKQAPEIAAINLSIDAWDAAHQQSRGLSTVNDALSVALSRGQVIRDAIVLALIMVMVMAVWRLRRVVLRGIGRFHRPTRHRGDSTRQHRQPGGPGRPGRDTQGSRLVRRRRSLERATQRTVRERSQQSGPEQRAADPRSGDHSVYDDLPP